MRVLTTFFLFLIHYSFSQNSSFEGILKYRKITYSEEKINVNETIKRSDTSYFYLFLKNGNRIEIQDSLSNFLTRTIYLKSNCREYVIKNDQVTEVYTNDKFNGQEINLNESIKDTTILSEKCFGFRFEDESSNSIIYFSNNKIKGYDLANTCNFHYFNKYFDHVIFFIKKELKNSQSKTFVEIVEVNLKELDSKLFRIPDYKNIHITKE